MTEPTGDAELDELLVAWAARAERVNALIGSRIPATLVPATVVDFR